MIIIITRFFYFLNCLIYLFKLYLIERLDFNCDEIELIQLEKRYGDILLNLFFKD